MYFSRYEYSENIKIHGLKFLAFLQFKDAWIFQYINVKLKNR